MHEQREAVEALENACRSARNDMDECKKDEVTAHEVCDGKKHSSLVTIGLF